MFQFNFFNNNPSRAGKHKCTNTLYVYCHLCGAWESLEQMYLRFVFSIGTVAILFKFLVLFQRSQKLSNFILMFVFYSFGYQLIMSDQFGFYVLISGTRHRTFIVLEFKTQYFPLSFNIRTIFFFVILWTKSSLMSLFNFVLVLIFTVKWCRECSMFFYRSLHKIYRNGVCSSIKSKLS